MRTGLNQWSDQQTTDWMILSTLFDGLEYGPPQVDPSATEFHCHRQPAPCHAAAAGKKLALSHASRNLLKLPLLQFLQCAAAIFAARCGANYYN